MPLKVYNIGCDLDKPGCSEDQAIYDTVKLHMIRLARRDSASRLIKDIAKDIKKECSDDELCQAKAGFDYIFNNVPYRFDHKNIFDLINDGELSKNVISDPQNTEFIKAPTKLLQPGESGDCDCMSTALASIYLALGLACRFRIIAWKNEIFTHVYAEVGVHFGGMPYWIPSDTVIKQFGIEKTPIIRAESFRVDFPYDYDRN